MKIETHVHTRFSKDSFQLLFWIYVKLRIKRIDTVAITDHNTIKGGVIMKRYFDKNSEHKYKFIKGINVIVGSEIMTKEGEIIGLFLEKEIPSKMSASETINAIKNQNGLVYIPHPYDEKRKKTVLNEEIIVELSKYIDLIEVYNGRNYYKEYKIKQNEIANKIDAVKIIGSDSHTFIETGRNYMKIVECDISPIELKESLKNAKFYEEPVIKLSHKLTIIVKTIKLIKEGKIDELYRIVIKKITKRM